ncbi:DUF1778 domain-containing protein [Brucella sp. TWI432]
MLAFHNEVIDIDEKSSERMNFRTKPRIKKTIQRAAAHEHTFLQSVDHEAFFTLFDNAPDPTVHLKAAFARHKKTALSK